MALGSLFGSKVKFVAPMTGKLIDITEVEDITFAQKFLGDGLAIIPTEGKLYSPVDGKIIQVFHTKHAIGIEVKGIEILIHIGMNTVELKGEGFTVYVKEGDVVRAGDKLVDIDLDLLKEKGYETATPIVITNMEDIKSLDKVNTGVDVIAGESEILTIKK